jgi:glycosyltransferase involved in cell wall biosynthesis
MVKEWPHSPHLALSNIFEQTNESARSKVRIVNKLVSILIPCFNAERWISHAIESAMAQTWPCKEIIVVDDGSTDESQKAIRRYENAIVWESGPNRGGNAARNRLLELANGEWIQYLDADDYLLSSKVQQQMEFVGTRPNVDVVFSPVTWEYWSEGEQRRELLQIPEPHDLWALLASWNLPQTGGPIWRKQAIVDVGGWRVDQPCCQEHELYLRLLMAGKKFEYCPSNGAVYRQWSSTTVCKADIPEVHRRRLEIEQRLEDYLRRNDLLTAYRQRAINQARFQTARDAWQYSPGTATQIMEDVNRTESRFSPSGSAAPAHYRLAYHLLGFRAAERLAAAVRRRRTAVESLTADLGK